MPATQTTTSAIQMLNGVNTHSDRLTTVLNLMQEETSPNNENNEGEDENEEENEDEGEDNENDQNGDDNDESSDDSDKSEVADVTVKRKAGRPAKAGGKRRRLMAKQKKIVRGRGRPRKGTEPAVKVQEKTVTPANEKHSQHNTRGKTRMPSDNTDDDNRRCDAGPMFAAKEFEMKQNYYKTKLDIMQQRNTLLNDQNVQIREQSLLLAEKNVIFQNIAASLETLCSGQKIKITK